MEDYAYKAKRSLKIFLIVLAIYVVAYIIALLFQIFKGYEWLDKPFDFISLGINIYSIAFVIKNWREHYVESKKSELEQLKAKEENIKTNQKLKEYYDKIGLPYEPLEIMWFDHKKSRRTVAVLNLFAIIINLLVMVSTLLELNL
jgi:hypothetical protein